MSYANAMIIGKGRAARALSDELAQRCIDHLLLDEEAVRIVRPMGGGYPGFQVVTGDDGGYARAVIETLDECCADRATPGLFVLGACRPAEMADLIVAHLESTPLVV